jgi:hypothetical protein
MSNEFSSDEEYLPYKYPCSARPGIIRQNWNVCKEDLQDAGPSHGNNSEINSHVDVIEKKYCEICHRSFKNLKGLKIHHSRLHSASLEYSSNLSKEISTSKTSTKNYQKKIPWKFESLLSPSQNFERNSVELSQKAKLQDKLIFSKRNIQILRRIPKVARFSASGKLASIINNCLNSNSLLAWENLLLFAYKSFNINEYNVKNLTLKIKNNIASFSLPTSISKNKFSNSLGRRIEAKVNDFDIKGAVKFRR